MKRSASLSKVLSSSKLTFLGCAFAFIALNIAVKSCKSSDEELARLSLEDKAPVKIADVIATTISENPYMQLAAKSSDGNRTLEYAAMHTNLCKDPDAARIEIISHLDLPGSKRQPLTFRINTKEEILTLLLNDLSSTVLDVDIKNIHDLARRACEDNAKNTGNELQISLLNVLQAALPDCRIKSQDKGFKCALKALPSDASDELLIDKLEKDLFVRLKRQSYSLSRKITLTRQMIRARDAFNKDEAMHTLCTLLTNTVRSEVPLVLDSDSMQHALCEQAAAEDIPNLLHFAISHSVSEIESLIELFEKNSRLGTLVIHVPQPQNVSNELLVEIEPTPETLTNIWDPIFNASKSSSRHCLNPIFLKSSATAILHAAIVKPLTDHSRLQCVDQKENLEWKEDIMDYLASNLTSERSFSMDNGRGILLRMAEGEYNYSISSKVLGLMQNNSQHPSPPPVKGQFEWRGKRPLHTIRSS